MMLQLAGIVTLAMTQVALGQPSSQPPGSVPSVPQGIVATADSVSGLSPAPSPESSTRPARGWISGEYLLWWVKGGSAGAPLLTTGDPATATGGFLGDNSTRILFGDRNINYGAFSGGRVSMGYWFGEESRLGIETSGFLLENRTARYSAASDAAGNPQLILPFQDQTATETGLVVSNAVLGSAGRVDIFSSSRLWGAEINGTVSLLRNDMLSLDLVAGFRYLDLRENLQITAQSSVAAFDVNFIGTDIFNTRNQFYGGQIGARFGYHLGRLSAHLTGKVAFGTTQELVGINGSTTLFGAGVLQPGTTPGFVYSQSSNIGSFSSNTFSVVPQAQVKIGWDLLPRVRVTGGYDFLFWSNVVRPGNQIDRNVNTTQQPVDFGGAGTLAGAPLPAPQTNRSDFWSQGLSFGIEFKW